MAKLSVIHISDIHLKNENDSCLKHVENIASACFKQVREADGCLIAFSGDLAYSGNTNEYEIISNKFIKPLVEAIKKETTKSVFIAITPGNHDCLLLPSNDVRDDVIQNIIDDPAKASNKNRIDTCTSVQKAFFELLNEHNEPKVDFISNLFWQQQIEINNKVILISSLNAAWMSQLPETQGQLVYPIELFEEHLSKQAQLHLALIHHPFNWYNQPAYHQLRKRLRSSCTAVLSGHEHIGNIGKIEEQLTGSSLFFESAALQPHDENSEPGFSSYLFDIDKKEVVSNSYTLLTSGVHVNAKDTFHSWSDDGFLHNTLDITHEFKALLSDAGGNFTHSAKEKLTLEDVFVWPDLRVWENDDISKPQVNSSKEIISFLEKGKHHIIYGDDKSGKTTLLYWFFRELTSRGFSPVYLAANEINIKEEKDAEKYFTSAIIRQYKHPNTIDGLKKEKKIFLLDDIDRLKSGVSTIPFILNYAKTHFSGICLTAASGFEVTNIASKEAAQEIASFISFDLMRFGYKLRHHLIKKWCSISTVHTKQELDKSVDEAETIINSVIGRRLIPEHPIYLLILLQSCEQHKHGEIQNSGLSFYYQFLITKSLGEVGVKPNELDEHFNYLSRLSWFYRERAVKELEKVELLTFNKEFSDRFTTVDLDQRLELLTKSRILAKRGDYYSFSYPYVYYFFIGRFLAKNLENEEIKAWIIDSCKKLYLRDRAHSIMFLTHHIENRWVIEQICNVLQECFTEKKPVVLDKADTNFLNSLVQDSTTLVLQHSNPEENQTTSREFKDNISEDYNEEEPNEYDLLSFASKWNLLLKTAEILGLILKNYYGSLERHDKELMIKDVFDAPLRALRIFLDEFAVSLVNFVNDINIEDLTKNKQISNEKAKQLIHRHLFRYLGMVSAQVIASTGSFVASEKLKEDVEIVIKNNPTIAFRLIEAASRLLKPGNVPIEKIKILARDLDNNHYAFGILQTLGFYHMYMFHTSEQEKQALSKTLKISFETAKAIELKKPGRTVNK